MGGKALKNGSVRLETKEYKELTNHILGFINSRYPSLTVLPIRSIRSKKDHGDLDLLMVQTSDSVMEDMIHSLDPVEIVKSPAKANAVRWGPVTNIGVDVGMRLPFQVDFIQVPYECFNMAYHYYAYNDLGNLMGVVADNAGLVLGHRGLEFNVYDKKLDTKLLDKVVLTRNWWEAIETLGYDSNKGFVKFETDDFHSMEDIFKYATSTSYFNSFMHSLEGRSHRSRARDRKRTTYMEFIQWVEQNKDDLPDYEWKNENREAFLEHVFEKFPEAARQIQKLHDRSELMREAKSKFNAWDIKRITGYQGQELGEATKNFREFIEENFFDYHQFIVDRSVDELEALVHMLENERRKAINCGNTQG